MRVLVSRINNYGQINLLLKIKHLLKYFAFINAIEIIISNIIKIIL